MRTNKLGLLGALSVLFAGAGTKHDFEIKQNPFHSRRMVKPPKNYSWKNAWNGKKYEQGEIECARRRRQIAAGIIPNNIVYRSV